MKCHILFSGKNKKNISNCRRLKILPRVLRVKKKKKKKKESTLSGPVDIFIWLGSFFHCIDPLFMA